MVLSFKEQFCCCPEGFSSPKTPPKKTAPGLGNPEISKIEGADPFGVEVDRVWCFEKVGVSFFFFGGGRNLKQNAANVWVVVGLKYLLCSPRTFGEDELILTSIFFKGGW